MSTNQPGVIVTPGHSAISHPSGDTGFENGTAGTKFTGIIGGVKVFEISDTNFSWKGHSGYPRSDLFRKSAAVTTTDNTATTILSLGAIAIGESIHFRVFVGGEQNDESDACSYHIVGCATNAAGTTAIKGTTSVTAVESNSSCDCAASADDTNELVLIKVTGITAETYLWVGYAEYFFISTAS